MRGRVILRSQGEPGDIGEQLDQASFPRMLNYSKIRIARHFRVCFLEVRFWSFDGGGGTGAVSEDKAPGPPSP